MKWKYAAVLASFLMVTMAFAVVATAEDTPTFPTPSALDNWLQTQADFAEQEAEGITAYITSEGANAGYKYTDGPYPIFQDDGSPPGSPNHMPWGSDYVSDINYVPPHNAGGWYSSDAMGGAGEFSGGDTHESWIGDQNGNGVIEWITGFSYRPFGEDGIDNDGDGCVDEKTFGVWDGQTGCDLVPDQITYYETGGLVDSGGDTGDLMTNVDWYSAIQATEVYRAFVSPKWMAYQLRGYTQYPQMAGEFISYYAYESNNGVNANPEMDSDMSDQYIGSIDARGFPARPPVDTACAAGYRLYMGIMFQREDGWVIVSWDLYEYADGNDWNGDGDTNDRVAAYFGLDPATGNCRDNAVNIGIYGVYQTTSGDLVTPMYTYENNDGRDWDNDGTLFEYQKIYHDVSTTWAMKGKMYTSFTFTASVPAWGFGWNAIYESGTYRTYPLKFGVGFQTYSGPPYIYRSWNVLTDDEDGNRHTYLPRYYIGYGMPVQALGGECLQIVNYESQLYSAGIRLMPAPSPNGDANGDGDYFDFAIGFYCPEKSGGGGSWIVEPTSKFAQGLYVTPLPMVVGGQLVYYDAGGVASGLVMTLVASYESAQHDDANGNLIVAFDYFHMYYWIQLTKPEFEFVPGSLSWVFTGDVQPGGTVIGQFKLLNTGETNIKIQEDGGVENDKGYKHQGLSAKDQIGPDGTIVPRETATFFFAMTVSAGAPIGPLDVKIIVSYGGVTKEGTMTLPIILKMFGDEQSCYRHRQNALRTLRAFDMDDDEGMLHNLEPGDVVNVGGALLLPEDAIMLLVSFFENGCGGGDDVEHAHSASSSLTGHYGMGMQYWGFAPGQEEGNEGNGNGGLTGQDRKDVYGF
ncbi:MAG: hypothetical protein KAR39_00170 [Thermoplasmata archaeon]|nr:hypothetical protein [Thermoplasmata archaeon]